MHLEYCLAITLSAFRQHVPLGIQLSRQHLRWLILQKRMYFLLIIKIPVTGTFSTAKVTIEALLEIAEQFSGLFGFLNRTISFNSSNNHTKIKHASTLWESKALLARKSQRCVQLWPHFTYFVAFFYSNKEPVWNHILLERLRAKKREKKTRRGYKCKISETIKYLLLVCKRIL